MSFKLPSDFFYRDIKTKIDNLGRRKPQTNNSCILAIVWFVKILQMINTLIGNYELIGIRIF